MTNTYNLSLDANRIDSILQQANERYDDPRFTDDLKQAIENVPDDYITEIGINVPSGFTAGPPLMSNGSLSFDYAAGYSATSDIDKSKWNTAYNWGNHADAGYIDSGFPFEQTDKDDINALKEFYVTVDDIADVNNATPELTSKLNALIANGGGVLRLGRGDFIVNDKLPISSNITIVGAGMPSYATYWCEITAVASVGGKLQIQVADLNGVSYVTHRLMSGDVLKIGGLTEGNGIREISSVDAVNKTILVDVSVSGSVALDADPIVRISVLDGGTMVRFQNHMTGAITTNKRFFDESDVRNFNLSNIGFIGPGISSAYGGGMRFRRVLEPDGRSRAITGYYWDNVLVSHVPMDAIRFDQLIYSYLGHMNINRCVGDGILFKGGSEGGTTTSVHIDSPYIQNVRRGIAFYTAAYCTLTNPVIEGTSYGYYVNRGIGMTFNCMASETIKFGTDGQSGGVTGLFIDCYGTVINAPTIYYNTEESQWSKASLIFIDPKKRTESQTAVINGGHIHWSLGEKIPVIGTRWNERTVTLYVDPSNDSGFVPASGSSSSSWIGNSAWDDSVLVEIVNCSNSAINDRYKVTRMKKLDLISDQVTQHATTPTVNDDSSQGYTAFTSYWEDTTDTTRNRYYFCIQDTVGAAIWVRVEETYEIDINVRKYAVIGKQSEPNECYVFRLGRNYGVDVATDNIQRVLETSTNGSGTLSASLDISHIHPTRFETTCNYDPYYNGTTAQYTVKSIGVEDIGGTDYIKVIFVVANLNGHVQNDLIVPANSVYVKLPENGVDTKTYASYLKEDAATGNLFLYFSASDYFVNGDVITIDNCMLKEMNGTHVVNTATVTTDAAGMPCVNVVTTTTGLRTNLRTSVDYAVYVADKWSAPVSNEISMIGLDTLFVYDKVSAIGSPVSRRGKATALTGTTTTTIDLPAANNFEYEVSFTGSLDKITYQSNTYNTVTFLHDAVASDTVFAWKAIRKLSPGVQAIYDRN